MSQGYYHVDHFVMGVLHDTFYKQIHKCLFPFGFVVKYRYYSILGTNFRPEWRAIFDSFRCFTYYVEIVDSRACRYTPSVGHLLPSMTISTQHNIAILGNKRPALSLLRHALACNVA